MRYSDERGEFQVEKVAVRNRRKASVRFRVEPWGETYELPRGATFQVTGRGPVGDGIEVRWNTDGVSVYAWPGAALEVRHRGVPVGPDTRETAPRIPAGMRVSEWVAEVSGSA